MSECLAGVPLVREIFARLFSHRWIGQWQQQWAVQQRPPAARSPARRAQTRCAA